MPGCVRGTRPRCCSGRYSALALISAVASFGIMAPLIRQFNLNRLAIGSAILAGAAMISISITFPAQLGPIWITGGLRTLIGTLAPRHARRCFRTRFCRTARPRHGRQSSASGQTRVSERSNRWWSAGIVIALTVVAFGILLIAAGLVLTLGATSRPAVSQTEPAAG